MNLQLSVGKTKTKSSMATKKVPKIKLIIDFFSLKGSIKSNKPFNIDAMDKIKPEIFSE